LNEIFEHHGLMPDPDEAPPEDPPNEIVGEIKGDRRLLKTPTVAKRFQFRTKMDTAYRPGEIVQMSNRKYKACDKGKTLRRVKS